MKDPDGANLDRLQIVKGWLDEDRQDARSRPLCRLVRQPNARPKAIAGASVAPSIRKLRVYANSIGAVRTDGRTGRIPDFIPNKSPFYYVRVLEIPTPRWTAYDAERFNVKMSAEVPMVTQERAYTSPIWYRVK